MASKTTTGTEAASGPNFPPFKTETFAPQLVWLALTFGMLYFVLSRIVLPRIADVIDERANRIKRDLDAAERLKVETDKAIAGYEDALAVAKNKANQIAGETRAALTADTDREKLSIESQLNARLADAETRISAMKTKALSSVNDIAGTTAVAIVGRLVGDEPSADELKRALAPVAGA
ncbi:MAG: F0F1 ATP synthase subunit B' [Hyphomicrobium aestuarii]|nr:F0F1 ATP synthase subunit B' [Hyphomicrobium aestuarii]